MRVADSLGDWRAIARHADASQALDRHPGPDGCAERNAGAFANSDRRPGTHADGRPADRDAHAHAHADPATNQHADRAGCHGHRSGDAVRYVDWRGHGVTIAERNRVCHCKADSDGCA